MSHRKHITIQNEGISEHYTLDFDSYKNMGGIPFEMLTVTDPEEMVTDWPVKTSVRVVLLVNWLLTVMVWVLEVPDP